MLLEKDGYAARAEGRTHKSSEELCRSIVPERVAGPTRHGMPSFSEELRGEGLSGSTGAGLVRLQVGGKMKFLDGLRPLGLLVLRVALGVIFVYHGYSKLVHADPAMRAAFVQHGLPAYFVGLAGILETFGAVLLFLGLFTRPAALLLAVEMAVAIWKVHLHNGLIGSPDHPGFELPLAAGALAFALIFFGGGPIAIDHALRGGGTGISKR